MEINDNDRKIINKFCRRSAYLIEEILLPQLIEACQIPQVIVGKITNGTIFLGTALKDIKIHPLKLAEHCIKLNAPELASRLEALAEELGWNLQNTTVDYLKDFTEEKTVNNLLMTLRKHLNEIDLSKLLATADDLTFELVVKEMYRSKDLSRDLTELVSILEDIDKNELSAVVATFKSTICKLSIQDFQDQLFIYLESINVELSNLILELKEFLLAKNIDMPILTSESASASFRDLYVELMITDDVDKITTHEESGQLELENCVKRSGPYLEKYDSKHANKGAKLIERLRFRETKRVVLIGNPGTGKSIYCRKIIHMYIDKELPNRWALLMTCRNTQWQLIEHPKSKLDLQTRLEKFIEAAIEGYENWKAIKADIMETNGKNLLLIIDGLDEFPMEYFDQSLLYKILRKDILPYCSLLITSRVGAFNEMMKKYQFDVKVEKIFQVLGFSKAQRDLYIKKRLGKKAPVYEERLRTILRNQRELDALSLIPVTIELLISLIEESGASQNLLRAGLNTLTDAYKEIIMYLIRRQLKRNQIAENRYLDRIEELPFYIFAHYMDICRLAFDGIENRKIMFREYQITQSRDTRPKTQTQTPKEAIESQTTEDALAELPPGLGLLVSSSRKKLTDTKADYSFPHLTIQEYLTAYHMSSEYLHHDENITKEEKRPGLLKFFTGEKLKVYRMVAKFMCGLLGKEAVFLISHIFQEDQVKWLPYDGCIRTLTVDRREKYAKYTKAHLGALPYIVETKYINMLAFKEAQEAQGEGTQFYFIIPNIKMDPIEFSSFCRVLASPDLVETPLEAISVDLMRMDKEDYNLMVESLKLAYVKIIHIKFNGYRLDEDDLYRIQGKYRDYLTTLKSSCRRNKFAGFYMEIESGNFLDRRTIKDYMGLIPERTIGLRLHACDFTLETIPVFATFMKERDVYEVQFLDLTRTQYSMDPLIHGFGDRTNIRGIHLEDTFLDEPDCLYRLLKRQTELQELTVRKTFPDYVVQPHLPVNPHTTFVWVK